MTHKIRREEWYFGLYRCQKVYEPCFMVDEDTNMFKCQDCNKFIIVDWETKKIFVEEDKD